MASDPSRPFVPLATGVEALPILHGSLEITAAVHAALRDDPPDHLCVELPPHLEPEMGRAVARLPRLSAIRTGEGEDARYLLVEPCEPLVEAVRMGEALGIPVHFVDRHVDPPPEGREAWPDDHAVGVLGYARWCREVLRWCEPARDASDALRERTMAHHCQQLRGRVVLVCGIRHVAGLRGFLERPQAYPLGPVAREPPRLLHLHPDSVREVLSEMPWLQRDWERRRSGVSPGMPDRIRLHHRLLREADDRAAAEEHPPLTALQRAALLQYARNLALSSAMLVPRLHELLLAARGVADDDHAWWLWEVATAWPGQDEARDIPTVRLRLEDLGRRSRRFLFQRRRRALRQLRDALRPRPREVHPGHWREVAEKAGPALCSHPPEDIFIESYVAHLRRRTRGMLAAEQRRVEPFTTSVLDGIDVRETVRNLAHDGRIYVREERSVRGRVGAVVLVFDPDQEPDDGPSRAPSPEPPPPRAPARKHRGEERYPYRMTWQGEHADESDMAFYSTPPLRHLVGPGISRCEYGGLLMTWPPGRMFGVWEDPLFEGWPRKAERLILAGLLYSQEQLVACIAARPPRRILYHLAGRFGRKLVYVPLGQLSPTTLRRIRTFHVLHGRHVRAYASAFIR